MWGRKGVFLGGQPRPVPRNGQFWDPLHIRNLTTKFRIWHCNTCGNCRVSRRSIKTIGPKGSRLQHLPPNIHTVGHRTTQFGMVTHVGIFRFDAPAAKRGRHHIAPPNFSFPAYTCSYGATECYTVIKLWEVWRGLLRPRAQGLRITANV